MYGKKLFRYFRHVSLFISIVFVFLIFTGTGCTNKKSPAKPAENNAISHTNTDISSKVKIKFSYHKSEMGDSIENFVNNFNKKNRNSVEVELVKIPEDKYDETMNMYFTSGIAPDVFEVGSEWLDSYVTKGWVLNLQNYCGKEFLNRFPDWVNPYIHRLYSDPGLYTLPASQMTIRLIYNRDLFKMAGLNPNHAPSTMNELKTFAKKISTSEKGNKKYGFALTVGDGRKCFEQFMEGTNTYNNKYYYDFKEHKYNLAVYSEWMQDIRDMKEDESLFPGEAILKSNNALEQFAQGNIGMMYVNSLAPQILEHLSNQIKDICDWSVAIPPLVSENSYTNGKVSMIPSVFYCVNGRSLNIKVAAEFWRYLYSPEYLGEMLKQGIMLPVVNDINFNTSNSSTIKKINEFFPSNKDSVAPVPPSVINDWSRFDAYIEALEESKNVVDVLKAETDNLNYQYNLISNGDSSKPNG